MSFELHKPIKLDNGETVTSLELDFEALSLADIRQAQKVKAFYADQQQAGTVSASALSPRLDEGLRIGLAWVAAMKSDRRLLLNDALKLSAKDALLLSEEALPFLVD